MGVLAFPHPPPWWHLPCVFCGEKVRNGKIATLCRVCSKVGTPEETRKLNYRRVLVLGKEIEVPENLVELLKRNPIEALSRVDPELAMRLKGKSIEVRNEGKYLVIYRSDAVFG